MMNGRELDQVEQALALLASAKRSIELRAMATEGPEWAGLNAAIRAIGKAELGIESVLEPAGAMEHSAC